MSASGCLRFLIAVACHQAAAACMHGQAVLLVPGTMTVHRRYPRKRSRYVPVLAVAIGAGTAAAEAIHGCPQESAAANSTTNSWCAALHPAYSIGNELTAPTTGTASTCQSISDVQSCKFHSIHSRRALHCVHLFDYDGLVYCSYD